MQQLSVELVPLLRDNYVFVLHRQGLAAVVDPALAEPVIAALERQGLELVAILHTHHHSDHIGGTPGLLARWPGAAVLASREDRARIPLQTRGVAGGCGRLFEGSAAQMRASLQRLAELPAATQVWCAHEYTEANLRWAAATVDPEDGAAGPIRERLAAVISTRARGVATIPSTVGMERATNLFVRATSSEQLAVLRRSKDQWQG